MEEVTEEVSALKETSDELVSAASDISEIMAMPTDNLIHLLYDDAPAADGDAVPGSVAEDVPQDV